jgi:hypothetical protein
MTHVSQSVSLSSSFIYRYLENLIVLEIKTNKQTPVPYNYATSEMVPTYLISRLGFLHHDTCRRVDNCVNSSLSQVLGIAGHQLRH